MCYILCVCVCVCMLAFGILYIGFFQKELFMHIWKVSSDFLTDFCMFDFIFMYES
jgi:hypothetical protein